MICSKIANFGNFFIECVSNCNIAQEFSKRSKLVFYLGKKIVCSKKILANFQKQKSFLVSSRKCTKSYYCSSILKTQILAFYGKTDRSLEKKTFWKLSKTLNFASFFWMRLEIHYCICVLKTFKTWVFWKKRDVFFSKRHFKILKNAKHGYFALECLSKSIIGRENSKRSTAWDFREKRWVISKNCLFFLKMADIGSITIECVSNGVFAQKF